MSAEVVRSFAVQGRTSILGPRIAWVFELHTNGDLFVRDGENVVALLTVGRQEYGKICRILIPNSLATEVTQKLDNIIEYGPEVYRFSNGDGTEDPLADFLSELGMRQYADMLKEHDVGFDDLHLLTMDDLNHIGLKVGPARRLLKALDRHEPSKSQKNNNPLVLVKAEISYKSSQQQFKQSFLMIDKQAIEFVLALTLVERQKICNREDIRRYQCVLGRSEDLEFPNGHLDSDKHAESSQHGKIEKEIRSTDALKVTDVIVKSINAKQKNTESSGTYYLELRANGDFRVSEGPNEVALLTVVGKEYGKNCRIFLPEMLANETNQKLDNIMEHGPEVFELSEGDNAEDPLAVLLSDLGMEHYLEMLKEHDVGYDDLPFLTVKDLNYTGLKVGPARRLLNAASDLKRRSDSPIHEKKSLIEVLFDVSKKSSQTQFKFRVWLSEQMAMELTWAIRLVGHRTICNAEDVRRYQRVVGRCEEPNNAHEQNLDQVDQSAALKLSDVPPTYLNADQEEQPERRKDLPLAYLFWLFFGVLGGHRYYLEQWVVAVYWSLSAGACGIGYLVDLFWLPFLVKKLNSHNGTCSSCLTANDDCNFFFHMKCSVSSLN